MRVTTVLRLARGARLQADDARQNTTLLFGARAVRLRTSTPGMLTALQRLRDGATEAELAAGGDRTFALQWSRILGALRSGGWLDQTVSGPDGPLLTICSTAARPGFGGEPPVRPLTEDDRVQLSRFVSVRPADGVLRAETPLTAFTVNLLDPRLGVVLLALAAPISLGDLAKTADTTLADDELRSAVRMLRAAGIVSTEDEVLDSEQWAHHDLLFHSRTRMGRHDNPYGGTFRFVGVTEPLPAARPASSEDIVALERPDATALRNDPPLSEVVEARASVRVHDDDAPINIAQLAELLFRSQRLRTVLAVPDHGEVASRPYPAGGGLYELEIYPVVSRCDGLDPGMYHYDSARHRLERLSALDPTPARLLEMARVTCLMDSTPQVLLVVAARVGRVMWKYESVAYSVILKNVGSLYQTLYLHATAMGLAPCALGGGDSDLFAEATGLAYDDETSVGEFVLGSRPSGWVRRAEPEWSVRADV